MKRARSEPESILRYDEREEEEEVNDDHERCKYETLTEFDAYDNLANSLLAGRLMTHDKCIAECQTICRAPENATVFFDTGEKDPFTMHHLVLAVQLSQTVDFHVIAGVLSQCPPDDWPLFFLREPNTVELSANGQKEVKMVRNMVQVAYGGKRRRTGSVCNRTVIKIFGKSLHISGIRSWEHAAEAVAKTLRLINTCLGKTDIGVNEIKLCNVVSSFKLAFTLKMADMHAHIAKLRADPESDYAKAGMTVTYNKSKYAAVMVKFPTYGTLSFFASGEVIIMGVRFDENVVPALIELTAQIVRCGVDTVCLKKNVA